ncbi:MAG: alpha/beta hydrolase [Cyanobacteria bacterium HKST-UBA02]|nr:alpha/beta hydrolase [Cyanobacteria bacterium HKST-UBA02]
MANNERDPLFDLLARIRNPVSYREIIAQCLRHIYMGDPFASDEGASVPSPGAELMEKVRLTERIIAGLRCVFYAPAASGDEALPVLLYMHGGGFVVGCSEDTDYITRRICFENNLVVVSINYPLAPESVFPEALNRCLNVERELRSNADSFQFDFEELLLCGDSAGANLAAGVALRLSERGTPAAGLIMLAPWLDMNVELYDSFNRLAPDGIVYDAAFVGYARGAYVLHADWNNPLASPLYCDYSKLPPALLVTGTADPVFDQSGAFVSRAQEAGINNVELASFNGMPHCFYSFPGLFAETDECFERIAGFIQGLI